jgi:non-ribosomal peptide synthetase-like protein
MTELDTELLVKEQPAPPRARGALSVVRGPVRPDLIRDELLAEIFAAAVAAAPHAVAMMTMERKLTYAEVDHEASAIARGLVRRGIGPGDVVGLWGARGPELLICQIAIAKTGAAWLPFDADAPLERIDISLKDSEAKALLTSETFAAKARGAIAAPVVTEIDLIDRADRTPLDPRKAGATSDTPAYMIYTSGSTGAPKGIVITGRNICHYLRSANETYKINRSDIVFQGASIAFDLSMEEIWIPYLVGATLFVATPTVMGEADTLPDLMEEIGVTVLDTVPTLLSLMPRDVKSLRVIILGGEACPPAIAARWSKPGRTIFNSYGPTEATVVATVAEVRPDQPVTIGGPIANYTCYVADEASNLLERGVEGELLIGGPGVARGYLKREALTAEKFIANPFDSTGNDPILYRSGDAVAMEEDGKIAFHGRIDDQVKIRGFRVELGEIEAKLSGQPGVHQAAVVLRNDDGLDQLVAFLVADKGETLDAKKLRAALRGVLPPYMVPSRCEMREVLPRLPSGKINRNALKKEPLSAAAATAEAQEDPETETERVLLEAAQKVLPPQTIPLAADFFMDLGGHSLLAARFVSIVRQTQALARITLQDVYNGRSLRAIAALLDEKAAESGGPKDLSFTPPPLYRRFLCGMAQAAVIPFLLALSTAQWLGIFVSYMLLTDTDASIWQEIGSLLGVYVIVNIATLLLAIATKWLVIGRFKPGRYPIWGLYYFRWWLVQRMLQLTHIKWFQGSPLMRVYLRVLGADVGQDANISEVDFGAIDLVTIGAGTTIGARAKFSNVSFVGADMIVGKIDIGPDCYLGSSCVLEHDVTIEEGAELRDLTALAPFTRVNAWEIYDGAPGRPVGSVDKESLRPYAQVSAAKRAIQSFIYTILLLAIPPVGLLPLFPAFWVFDRIDDYLGLAASSRSLYMAAIPVMAWPTAFVMVLVTVAFIAGVRWTVLPRVREGYYSVFSWFYLRKWAVSLATEVTLETLSSLYATVYMRAWYRLMGAKIGKDSEISTNIAGRYDLVEIGDKCFIADEVILGDEDIRRGWMHLEKLRTGSRVFIGNDGVLPPGADIPDGALIGIKSKPPANDEISAGDTWFGSPPIKLPVRQKFDGGGAWTYEAPRWKKYARAVFEAVHISLPSMLFITFGTWAIEWFGPAMLEGAYFRVFWMFVAASTAIAAAMTMVVVGVKWATMGRYEPVTKPMWSWWAMRTEAVAVLYWGLAGKVMLDHLRCTPFLPWFMRLFGAKFGQGCVLDMTDITEFDCIEVGDFCNLNALSALQTHLYEDRVMKVGRVKLGSGVTVGAGSTVLYDANVGDYARLGPLTIVMKGESIPAHTEWSGAPAAPTRFVRPDCPLA